MPLKIVKGPPNSGRTEEIRRAYVESLPRRPVLVVPGTDDIFGWEERLTRERRAFLGGRVLHFRDLIGEILGRDPTDRSDLVSPLHRRALARAAVREGWPGIANRLERQPGLIDAALRAIDELRAALIDPGTFDDRAAGGDDFLARIGAVFRRYVEGLAAAGLEDDASLGLRALAAPLDGWSSRPVFAAGFDDLTELQLELLARLAAATEVTIAITHEDGNPAMAVTDRLLSRLLEHGTIAGSTTRQAAAETGRDPLLVEIERRFLRRPGDWAAEGGGADGDGRAGGAPPAPLDPGPALTLIRASGRRGEAEAVGARIAALVAGGAAPDRIAIAVDAPAAQGAVFRDVLGEYGIAATLECETPAAATAIGRGAIDLLRAARPGGTAADLLRYLRGPVGAETAAVDRVEYLAARSARGSAVEVAGLFRQVTGGPPPFWEEVRGDDPAGAITALVEAMVAAVLAGEPGRLPGAALATETQTATAIRRAVGELAGPRHDPPGIDGLLDALLSGTIRTWAVPAGSTVRIASPYSLRAKRFEHLFMVSLQERDPAAADGDGGPFLNRRVREALGIPQPNDPEDQELYLFHSCLSVPTASLCLSTRIADEEGRAEQPSPLIGEVTALFQRPGPDGAAAGQPPIATIARTGADVLFAPGAAPSEVELARGLAALDATGAPPPEVRAEAGVAARAEGRIAAARAIEADTRTLGPLTDPAVLAELAAREDFSPTALEAFTSCPFRWYVERGLGLQRFGPEPEAIARGELIHAALHEVYSARPGELPRPETLDEWLAAVGPAVERAAAAAGPDAGSASRRVMARRAAADVAAHVRLEAGRESPGFDPLLYEASFGLEEDGREGLDLGGWRLRGTIDRVDAAGDPAVGAGRRGVVIDYKSGNSSVKPWNEIVKERRLQLQLYMKALRELWGIEPVAALYQPVARGDRRPRGPIDEGSAEDLAYLDPYRTDRTEVAAAIEAAVATAGEAVARIRSGRIDHDPLSCVDHFQHAAVPDRVPAEDPDGNGR